MGKKDLNLYIKRFEQLMPRFHKAICGTDQCGLDEMHLTPHQFVVLKTLTQTDDCNMSDLSNKLGVTMGNVTGLIDRLVKEEYVTRIHDHDDRRIVKVALTGKGEKITQKIIERKHASLLKVLERSSEKDIETMLRIIEKIITIK